MKPIRARNARSIASGFGPSMTPMVDVTLVILIFFMASAAAFGPERMLRTVVGTNDDTSAASSSFAIESPRFRVVVVADGMVRGAGIEAPDGATFASALLDSLPGVEPGRLKLSVEPDPGAPWESVVVLLAELREAGVTDAPLGVTDR